MWFRCYTLIIIILVVADSVGEDQTAGTCRLILLYDLRKIDNRWLDRAIIGLNSAVYDL